MGVGCQGYLYQMTTGPVLHKSMNVLSLKIGEPSGTVAARSTQYPWNDVFQKAPAATKHCQYARTDLLGAGKGAGDTKYQVRVSTLFLYCPFT